MAFWIGIGAIVGALLGGMGAGLAGAAVLALAGGLLGALIGRSIAASPTKDGVTVPPPAPRYGTRSDDAPTTAAPPPRAAMTPAASTREATHAMPLPPELLQRLDALDARLARIETQLGGRVAADATSPLPSADATAFPTIDQAGDVGARAASESVAAQASPNAAGEIVLPSSDLREAVPPVPAFRATALAPESQVPQPAEGRGPSHDDRMPSGVLARGPDGTLQPAADATGTPRPGETRRAAAALDVSSMPPPRPEYGVARDVAPATPSPIWRWLTGGNAPTRIGIVILFFGVAFLLRYFAEIVTIPIAVKLAAAGAGGLLLAALGVVLARRRPAYGLSLEGAGMGIVYLVVFAAFRLYDALAPAPAIVLLVLVAATTTGLALRHDSQPLAALALAGGFLAPVLIRTDATHPALLFGYFAILNAAILALAWKRAWRPLNVLGFVFTFVLSAFWGVRFYTPAYYAIVQPFLALFFLFYVGIAVLHARRGPLDARTPVDGLLVFGVPIVAFALQMAIARGHRYGVAWSAGALAAFYGALAWLFHRRAEQGLALLARAFAVLGVAFGTLAIPFAVDPRVTSAWWAIEAAAVYWIGAVQRQRLARIFALMLEVAAALAFMLDAPADGARPFLNAAFLGAALIGLAAFATVWTADHYRDALGPRERTLVPWFLLWGAAWWTLAGIDEVARHLEPLAHANGALAWVSLTAAASVAIARQLAWPRIAWLAAMLLPAMALAATRELDAVRTTLAYYGWLVWPLAWGVQGFALRSADAYRDARQPGVEALRVHGDFLALAHVASAIALVAWASWEASEWVGRHTREGTVWIACAAALPALAYLATVLRARGSTRWPFDAHAETYGASVGTTVAALLAVWFVSVNLMSPGDPAPLPYAPLLNPLDVLLLAALWALARWADAWGGIAARTRHGAIGAAAFLALNGTVVRTAHHWGDVPWRLAALMEYKPLQAAMTLTWTATALASMLWGTRRSMRAAWMAGGALLAAVVVKLFAIDLAALSGLTRVIAFMGVGALLLVIGYVAPLPPSDAQPTETPEQGGDGAQPRKA